MVNWLALACLASAVLAQVAQAKEIAVFVHGLAGWGVDELGPLKYWSRNSVIAEFERRGFTVFQASVGPVSSNWDRACELFAQIKGTQVDYGLAHSTQHGHLRLGKDYTGKGFVPNWGPNNRIHLIGHSMGGSTVRMLERLLQEGDAAEKAASRETVSPLFAKQGNWIKTVTTFSAPLNGTPLIGILGDGIVDFIKTLVLTFAGATDAAGLSGIYDFDLDQFQLTRKSGESFASYYERIFSSKIWAKGYKDLAPYDLSVEGSIDLQKTMKQTYPGTRYFGFATEQTTSVWGCNFSFKCGWKEVGDLKMLLPLQPFANLIGSLDQDADDRKNDGLVPVSSSKCPSYVYGGPGNCQSYQGSWPENKWMWQVISRDHLQVIGFTVLFDPKSIYGSHAARLLAVSSGNYVAQSIDDGATYDLGADRAVTLPEQDGVVLSAGVFYALIGAAVVGVVAGVAMVGRTFQERRARSSSTEPFAARRNTITDYPPRLSFDVESGTRGRGRTVSELQSYNPAFAK